MNSQSIPLDAQTHRLHGWKAPANFQFASGDATAPMVLAEVPRALASFALGFQGQPGGGYQLVALQALRNAENLFVNPAGSWLTGYVPGHYRAYPFSLLLVEHEGQRSHMLGFDMGSGLHRDAPVSSQGEQRFFDDTGQLQPQMQQLATFLFESLKSRISTLQAVAALAAANVLERWTLPVDTAQDAAAPGVTNLYRINPAALNALPGGVLEILRDTRALDLAYAQMFSEHHVMTLVHLTRTRRLQAKSPPAPSLDLDQLFGMGGDTMKFNF